MTQDTTAKKEKTTTSSFTVFWLEGGKAQAEVFISRLANEALQFCEFLRQRERAGDSIAHVCISSEMVENVGLLGVNGKLPEDYNWTMRRKAFTPGRPSGSVASPATTSKPD